MGEKSKLSDFYEDAGDLLADFRNRYGGAVPDKKGKDPFAGDPDVMQAEREAKLYEQQQNMGF